MRPESPIEATRREMAREERERELEEQREEERAQRAPQPDERTARLLEAEAHANQLEAELAYAIRLSTAEKRASRYQAELENINKEQQTNE